jgi:hypothetical protein
MPIRTILLALVLALVTWAPAQAFNDLAPDTTVVVLEIAPDAGVPAGLAAALAELGWDEALATLGRLTALLGGADGAGMGEFDDLLAELEATCGPGVLDLTGLEPRDLFREGLLAVSISPFAPVPGVVALARPGDPIRAGALQDAIVDCFGDVRLEQDGVALHVLLDGSDLPLIVGRVDDVFFVATEPNLARGVVRRALASGEPSLAGTPLGSALADLTPGGLGFGIDFGALAGVAASFAGALPPDAAPSIERALAAIETLGVFAGRVGWDAEGLRFEQVHAWPSPAPDAALGRIFADARAAERPLWLPAGTVSTSSTVVPLRAILDYVDEWIAALEEPLGMRTDVRGLAADYLDLDLDAALLSWIGETVHTIQLAAFGTDLRTWVQGAPSIVAIPVLSEPLARAGLDDLGNGMLRVLTALSGLGTDPFSDPFGDPFGDPFADPFAEPFRGGSGLDAMFGPGDVVVTREIVDGFEVDRVRVGPTLDMAVAIVDGHLVLATPFRALGQLLEVRAAGPRLGDDPAWRSALDALPSGARAVSVVDAPAYLHALADLAELGAQPLASVLSLALRVGIWDAFGGPSDPFDDFGGWDDFGFDDDALTPPSSRSLPWSVDLDALPAVSLAPDRRVEGYLQEGAYAGRYELVGLEPGTIVEIEMTTSDWMLDTYLYVFDDASGEVLFHNDDAPGTDRSFVAFVVEPGVTYHVLTTSFGGNDEGAYDLDVRRRGGADDPVVTPEPEELEDSAVEPTDLEAIDPLTFGELLQATDLLPRALRLIADRSGLAVSTTTTDGDRTLTRMHWPIR